MIEQCSKCGRFDNLHTSGKYKTVVCYKCRYASEPRNMAKGVRQYNEIVNYFLRLDRSRGISYGKLAKMYKLDASNIRKRVLGILNKPM